MTKKAKVFIGVPLLNTVHSEFFRTFFQAQLLLPEEGVAYCELGKWGQVFDNRNMFAKQALAGDFTHLFMMDSDMKWPDASLSRLLYHDKDVVGGFYTTKIPPFRSTCFVKNGGGQVETYNAKSNEGLKKVHAIGGGCMLIKREVLLSMKWPYFYFKPDIEKEEFAGEDVVFCENAQANGFEVWCDLKLNIGHAGHMVITPYMENGESKARIEAV